MLVELIPEEKRRLHELEQQLVELERNTNSSSSNTTSVQASDIVLSLKKVSSRLDDLEKLAQKETKAKRDDFRRRITHLRNTHQHIKDSLDRYLKRNNYYDSKAKLFGGKVGNAIPASAEDMALELAENGSLARSQRMIGDYITIGKETLEELVGQRERLKGIQRKAFDMLNYLGISNNLLKSVERRDFVDKWIVIFGMVLIIILIFFVYYYFRK